MINWVWKSKYIELLTEWRTDDGRRTKSDNKSSPSEAKNPILKLFKIWHILS